MTKQCSSCGGFCGNVCQRENVTQPEPDVDYWIREATAARQAEMALRRELEAQPVQRQPLTEMDITAIAYSCRNNDAIHYVIAIARAIEAAHGIGAKP